MLYFFTGTDSEALRKLLSAALSKHAKGRDIVRITDAHTRADLDAALSGGGMFGGARAVVLDHLCAQEELREALVSSLKRIAAAEDPVFLLESGIDAETRKLFEKYAEQTERKDLPKREKDNSIFALGNALQQGKRKELWVGLQRQLHSGTAAEAIHGSLFWAAKQALLRHDSPRNRALVAQLAELPHEARRKGFDLEYALEHFALSRL